MPNESSPPIVTAVNASVRGGHARGNDWMTALCAESLEFQLLLSRIKRDKPALSNTEVLCAFFLMGAKQAGAEVGFLSLKNSEEEKLYDVLSKSSAIGIASPVYFGDRSSVCARFLERTREQGLLRDKIVAALSTGAKRNGGQETTNVLMLLEALEQGARVVGNGPPTSQFGATAIGGDLGTVIDDNWGLETAYATGLRAGQVAQIAQKNPIAIAKEKIKISILVTSDTENRKLLKRMRELVTHLMLPSVEFEILDLVSSQIDACIACNICPVPEMKPQEGNYACIITEPHDAMKHAREVLLRSDGILIAGINPQNLSGMTSQFEVFNERTRFLRRNDFELTNVPIASFLYDEVGAGSSLHAFRTLVTYLRHNALLTPPLREIWQEDLCLIDATDAIDEFTERVRQWRLKRNLSAKTEVSYRAGGPGGYRDTRLDHTKAER